MTLNKRDFDGATFPEWMHKYVSTRNDNQAGSKVVVTAGLHYIRGNRLPYFSVTCAIYEGGRDVGGGASHDLIGRLWPWLAPVIALHLSDSDGVPMHAEANGWYQLAGYYGGAGERYHSGNAERNFPIMPDPATPWKDTEYRKPTADECLASWAEHMRIPMDQARDIADGWRDTVQGAMLAGRPFTTLKQYHVAFVAEQKDRWKAEAEAAIALLDERIAWQAAKREE